MIDLYRRRTAEPPPYSTYKAFYPQVNKALTLRQRPYQEDAVDFLRSHPRAIIGDAPGLGKTFIATEAADLPAVVSCPVNLIDQWADFIAQEYPAHRVTTLTGPTQTRMLTLLEHLKNLTPNSWLIVNHDVWRQDYMQYLLPHATLIVDEFHHFRNREAKRSKGLFKYAQTCKRVYGLTATPVYKDVADLWHLLHILDPEKYASFWSFIQTYAVTSSYGYGTKILRSRNKERLDQELSHVMLARSYKQVGMYLPQRIDKQVVMRLNDADLKRYRLMRDFYREELENGDTRRLFNAGAVLHELRKLTITQEKLDEVKELAEEAAIATERPVIIFVWYRETARLIAEKLGAVEITGAMAPQNRATHAHSFPLIVATMESLSEGIDLSDARTVIFAEETYVPGQQYQALSRVIRHRTATSDDDETTPVICYWLRYKGTIDEVVHHKAQLRTQHNALAVLKEALLQDAA